LEGLDDRRRQGQRDVADPEVDDPRPGMRLAVGLGPPLDLGEEVARLQVQEGLVDPRHPAAPFDLRTSNSIRAHPTAHAAPARGRDARAAEPGSNGDADYPRA